MKRQPHKSYLLWKAGIGVGILVMLGAIVVALLFHPLSPSLPPIQVTSSYSYRSHYVTAHGKDYQYHFWFVLTNTTSHPLPRGFVDVWVNDRQGEQISTDCFWTYGLPHVPFPAHLTENMYCDVNGNVVDEAGAPTFQYVADTAEGAFVAKGTGKVAQSRN